MSFYTVFPKRGFVDPTNSSQPGSSNVPTEQVTLAFDALVSEAPQYSGQLTESVIENGAVINDHFTQHPLRLMVEGVISDTPLSTSPFATAAVAAGALGQASSGAPGKYQSLSARAFSYLESLYLSKALFDFVGGFKIYQSMMITEWRPVRTSDTGRALEFSMTMEQVTIVSTQTLYQPTQKILQQQTSHGQQPLKPLTAAQQAAINDSVNQALGPVGASESLDSAPAGGFSPSSGSAPSGLMSFTSAETPVSSTSPSWFPSIDQ